MEFIPICLECEYFQKGNRCKFYNPIPHEIKNREKRCSYFSDEGYELFTEEVYSDEERL